MIFQMPFNKNWYIHVTVLDTYGGWHAEIALKSTTNKLGSFYVFKITLFVKLYQYVF